MLLFFWIAKKTFRITSKCPLPDSFFSFHQFFWPPFFSDFLFFLLSGYWSVFVFCNKKRPFRNFHSKWPYLLQRQEAFGSLMFYSRSDPEPAFLICVYRYKYKSHNHINTRYCWRQSHFCYILYLPYHISPPYISVFMQIGYLQCAILIFSVI